MIRDDTKALERYNDLIMGETIEVYKILNKELIDNQLAAGSVHDVIYTGGYPRIYSDDIVPTDFYPSYIASYIQRDVGSLINPGNMATFRRFVQLCAGRIGQLCNISALAAETGISAPTAKEWLSILEASYILFFLEPHFNNFNKRLVKMPKLYFFDTGLACSLLRIDSPEALSNSHFQGSLFESFIIADLYKQYCNQGSRPSLYFWRDSGGAHEVDCILDQGVKNYPIQIKAGQAIATDSFRGIDYWNEVAKGDPRDSYIIYAGDEKQLRKQGTVIGWRESGSLIKNSIMKKK